MANRKVKKKAKTTNQVKKTTNTNHIKNEKNIDLSSINNINENKDEENNKINKLNIIISVIIFVCISLNLFMIYMYNVHPKIKIKKEYKVPENIVFLGDSITNYYDLDKFFPNYNVVNSGISGNKTSDILDNMKERVYRYNPSKVILLIGTNDTARGVDNDTIIKNIKSIVKGIKEVRPQTKIYIESIYPRNDYRPPEEVQPNENIKAINVEIKNICKEMNLKYINMYDILSDDEGNLISEYTKDGVHITDEGYEVITRELEKYINEKN